MKRLLAASVLAVVAATSSVVAEDVPVLVDIYCDDPTEMKTVSEAAAHGDKYVVEWWLDPYIGSCHSRVAELGERMEGHVVEVLEVITGTMGRKVAILKIELVDPDPGRIIYSYELIGNWNGRDA